MSRIFQLIFFALLLLVLPIQQTSGDQPVDVARLSQQLTPFLQCLAGQHESYTLSAEVEVPVGNRQHHVFVQLDQIDAESFRLEIKHEDYWLKLQRRADRTAMILPLHKVAFVGDGPVGGDDILKPQGITERLLSPRTMAAAYLPIVTNGQPQITALMLTNLLKLEFDEAAEFYTQKDKLKFQFSDDQSQKSLTLWIDEAEARIELRETASQTDTPICLDGLDVIQLDRAELERFLTRGVRRALEVLAPSPVLTSPVKENRRVPHGELRWIDGQRVVLLHGTPAQIGRAHGMLLKAETERCIDSVLHMFGVAQTINSGRWFRHELEAAYQRLQPHIPPDHKTETIALAEAAGWAPELVQTVNVFPELFHCSGFAVFGKATQDGKLYHGRVLDYMTTIGLQDASTTFVIAVDGKIPFVTVGYGGFIGSVSGMNDRGVSLGEMGGRGEGQWDGVPMATLMRRGLEECSSLEQVKTLWTNSPRTCEYFYVFADGNTNEAVGVAATPESIEFVQPGQAHPLLGDGIEDAVVLSAGSRLETLRARVKQRYGQIDADVGKWLMSRPVAMKSNLHNVLFVPADGVLYVANADHKHPAAERPYVRLDLHELLRSISAETTAADAAPDADVEANVIDIEALPGRSFPATDSLDPGDEPSADARECLEGLCWEPTEFVATCAQSSRPQLGDLLIRFPSPVSTGDERNDQVAMEWYVARDKQQQPIAAPAIVVVHESGSKMTVGRMIARGLRRQGLHAFLLHLPYYGERRTGEKRPDDVDLVTTMRQAIADVRRARDAVAALPLVDRAHIALQGTSLGGFVSATAAGLDRGYDSVFVTLAGGNLYDLIQHGAKDTAKVREKLAQAGLTGEKLRLLTRTIEPTRVAHRLDPQRTWLYSGRFDTVVLPRHALALAKAAHLDDSHHIRLLANHYTGIVYLPFVLSHIRSQIASR